MEEKKKRGRPQLSPEERELRRLEKNRKASIYRKTTGNAAQKKYRKTHPEKTKELRAKQHEKERDTIYQPRLRVPVFSKEKLEKLCADTGLSITQLFFSLVKEKYGVDLSAPNPNNENKSNKD